MNVHSIGFMGDQADYIAALEKRIERTEHAIGVLLNDKLLGLSDGHISYSDEVLQSFVDKVNE